MQGLKTTPTTPKKKILILNSEYPPIGGGAGTATANLARNLAAQGLDVKVVTARYDNLPALEQKMGFDLIRIATLRKRADRTNLGEQIHFILASFLYCLALFRRWKPDVIWAFFGFPSGIAAWMLKMVCGIPYIVSLRGGDVPGFRPYDFKTFHKIGSPFIKLVWRNARAVVANSRGLQHLARAFYDRVPIQVIPNGVDLEFFHPTRKNDKTTQLLFVGRVVYQKGLDLLANALKDLRNLDWQLTIVGDGSYKEHLHQLIEQNQLTQRVDFHGWCNKEKVLPLLSTADIFINPSRHEGMPNAVLEAMACGLPIIATRIAGNEDLVVDGKNGLLVRSEDVAGLQKALQSLIVDRNLCKKMGSYSRQLVEEKFSWQAAGEQYVHVLTKAAEKR